MYLLLDEGGRIAEDADYERLTFESAEDAEQYAIDQGQFDWMVVKFVCFT